MKSYTFGQRENPTVLLLPDTCCHWKQNFGAVIPLLEENISVDGTTIHVFYAVKIGEQYGERYRRHFQNPDIRRHELWHEELLMQYPKMWAEEVQRCCGMGKAAE